MTIYNYTVKDGQEKDVSLKNYEGKILLIVNTATKCGFTPQYKGLEELYEKYNEEGFEILDFPCNQFKNQAPGTNEEITGFCQINFGTKFPQFAKIDVNGDNEDPLYTYLKSQQKGTSSSEIKWNFTKFLIDKKGNVVNRFESKTTPEEIDPEIKKLLEE